MLTTIIKDFLQISWDLFKRAVRQLQKEYKLTHRIQIFCIKYGGIVGCARVTLIPLTPAI